MSKASVPAWADEEPKPNGPFFDDLGSSNPWAFAPWRSRFSRWSQRLLNANLDKDASIGLRVGWPLILLPIALINQILAPHPVWIVLLVSIAGVYAIAILWLRSQVKTLDLLRTRLNENVVAGEPLIEQFVLRNSGYLPVLWAAVEDASDLPGYNPSRVVACGAESSYKWQTDALCGQRGLFQLGPTMLGWSDPLGLLVAEKHFPDVEKIVIYPQIAHLPEFQLPFGSVGGSRQLRHPLIGSIRSASVRPFLPGDTLRHVHWPATARHRNLMVTELDAEHGGEVWLILDLNEQAHQGNGDHDTLEYSIRVVASLAAQLLHTNERLSVGLLMGAATAGSPNADMAQTRAAQKAWAMESANAPSSNVSPGQAPTPAHDANYAWLSGLQVLAPQSGEAQFWEIMGALAMAQPVQLPLSQLLQSSRPMMSNRQSLIVITADLMGRGFRTDTHSQVERANGANTMDGKPETKPVMRGSPSKSEATARSDKAAHTDGTNDGDNGEQDASESGLVTTPEGLPEPTDWLDALAQHKMRGRNSVVLIQYDAPTEREQVPSPNAEAPLRFPNDDIADEHKRVAETSSAMEEGAVNSNIQPESASETADDLNAAAVRRQASLMQQEIGCTLMPTSQRLVPLHPRKRVRREVRSTPMGGAVTVEIEEVG